jgi:hypothetical protein
VSRGVQSEKFLKDAARGPRLGLAINPAARKRTPITSGVLDYFPAALAAVAEISVKGNEQHNPGQPLHWARGKSQDHADCITRHLIERGSIDIDGARHSAKLAWRALALLQTELEEEAAELERLGEEDELVRQLSTSNFVPDHELPQTQITHELVQVGKRQILLPTPEEALRRIQAMDQCDSR